MDGSRLDEVSSEDKASTALVPASDVRMRVKPLVW